MEDCLYGILTEHTVWNHYPRLCCIMYIYMYMYMLALIFLKTLQAYVKSVIQIYKVHCIFVHLLLVVSKLVRLCSVNLERHRAV